jgi:hypothetical protein
MEELRQIVQNLQQGRHVLITGPRGMGKSRLMHEAELVLGGLSHPIFLAPRVVSGRDGRLPARVDPSRFRMVRILHVSPMGDLLKEFCELLFWRGELLLDPPVAIDAGWSQVKQQLTRLGSAKVQDLVIRSVSGGRHLCFLDSLDRITPPHHQFLERLLQAALVCAGTSQLKDTFHFRKVWASFVRVDLAPLSESESMQLVFAATRRFGARTVDATMYGRQIAKSAGGNPFHILVLTLRGSQERHLNSAGVRELGRVEEGEYFNMGPVYIYGASVFTLFKIFSIGLDNTDFYIYFSALGFLVYLTFRVFRNFFLFRPQKYGR